MKNFPDSKNNENQEETLGISINATALEKSPYKYPTTKKQTFAVITNFLKQNKLTDCFYNINPPIYIDHSDQIFLLKCHDPSMASTCVDQLMLHYKVTNCFSRGENIVMINWILFNQVMKDDYIAIHPEETPSHTPENVRRLTI